ncbi:MAG: sigma-70 family RNA polymerase sigma factor [Phycisphaerales bacterium]|nr:MAG: sigma-70 family RNA polymerase sigma factor [Phycisphaerales bacterium]
MLEDKLLLWRMKRRSSEALSRIYEKYKNDLLALAMALLHDINAAEDVVHDVFVSFVEVAEEFRLTGSLKGYLLTCVANLSRDRNRARLRAPAELNEADLAASRLKTPEQTVISTEELQRLRCAIAQLPYEQREAVILHLQGGRTFRQIAASQHVPIGTIQSRYRYGLDKLRHLLDSEEEE